MACLTDRSASARARLADSAARRGGCTWIESLERRDLRAADPQPGDGHDYIFVAAGADDPVTQIAPHAVPAQTGRPSNTKFGWFDGTRTLAADAMSNKIKPVYVDSWSMWPHDNHGNITDIDHGVNEANSRQMAHNAAAVSNTLVLDIEHWPIDIRKNSSAVVDKTIADFQQLIGWIRQEEPTLHIGIYGLLSIGDMYRSTAIGAEELAVADPGSWWESNLPDILNGFAGWQAANEYLRPLADAVDAIFPSLYTQVTDNGFWENFALRMMDDAQRYGKPVIPFLWGRYHNSVAGVGNQLIDTATWQHELDVVRAHADGVVVWDGAPYDPALPWVQSFVNSANADPFADNDDEDGLYVIR